MICQCKVNYLSLACIYCTLLTRLSELPYLFLEIINPFIIVFIFSSFSFSSNLSKKKRKIPWKCSTLLPPNSLTAVSCSLMQTFEAHKGRDDSAKNGGAASEIVAFSSIQLQDFKLPSNPLGQEIKHNPSHLTLSGPT